MKVLLLNRERLLKPSYYCAPMNAHNGMGAFLNLSLLRKCCLDQIPTIQVNYYSAPQKVKGKLSICDFFFPSALCQKVVTCDSRYYFGVIMCHSISCPKAFHLSCRKDNLYLRHFPPFLCYYLLCKKKKKTKKSTS